MSNLLSTVRKLDTGEEGIVAEPLPSVQDATVPRSLSSGKISFFPSYITKQARQSEESGWKEEASPKSSAARSQLHFTSPQLPPRPSLVLRPLGARPSTTLLSKLESIQNTRTSRLGDPQEAAEILVIEDACSSAPMLDVPDAETDGSGSIDKPQEPGLATDIHKEEAPVIERAEKEENEQPMELECIGVPIGTNSLVLQPAEDVQEDIQPLAEIPVGIDSQRQQEVDHPQMEEATEMPKGEEEWRQLELARKQVEEEKRDVEELRKRVDVDLRQLEEGRKGLEAVVESQQQLELERQRFEEEKKALQTDVEVRLSELDASRNRLEDEKREYECVTEMRIALESERHQLEEERQELKGLMELKDQLALERQQLENERQALDEGKQAVEDIKRVILEEKGRWEAGASSERLALQQEVEKYQRRSDQLAQQASEERRQLLSEAEAAKEARLQMEEEVKQLRGHEARISAERKKMETEQRQWQALADGWQRRQKELEAQLVEEKEKSQNFEKAVEVERKLYLDKYKALEESRREDARKYELAQNEKEELASHIGAKEDKLKEGQSKLRAKKEKYNQKKHKLEQEKLMLLDDRVWFTELRKKLEQELSKLEEERRKFGEEREKQERILLKLDEERTYIERMYREEQSRLEATQKKRLEKKEKKKQLKMEEERKREEERKLQEEKDKEEQLNEEQRKKEEEARLELEASLNIQNLMESRQENVEQRDIAEQGQDDPLISNSGGSRRASAKKPGVSFSLPEQDAKSPSVNGIEVDGPANAMERPKCTDEPQTRPFSYPTTERRDPNSFHFLSAQEWAMRMEGKAKYNNGPTAQWQRIANKPSHSNQESVLANGLPPHVIFEYALAGIPMMFEVDPKCLAERLQAEGRAQSANKLPSLRARPAKKRPASVLHPNAATLPQVGMAQQLTQKRAKMDDYWDSLLLS